MFRNTLIILLLLSSLSSVCQVSSKIFKQHNKKATSFGLVKIENGNSDTIYSAVYDQIFVAGSSFVLCKTSLSKQGKNHYEGVTVIDSEFNKQAYFDVLIDHLDSLLLVELNGKQHLFDTKKSAYILENCSNIELHKAVRPHTSRYYNSDGYQYIYDYYYRYSKEKEFGVYKVDEGIIIQEKKADKPTIVFEDAFIILGGKVKDLYSLNGELLQKDLIDYDKFESFLNDGDYYRLVLENGNQAVLHNNHVIIKDFEGKFNLELTNNNRLRVWKNGGYIAVDSTGRIITPEPYDRMFAITPDKRKGVYHPNLVQQNEQWFFVDNNFMPINNEKFVDAELVGETYFPIYFYLIKDKIIEEPKSLLFSRFGKKVIDHRVETAYFISAENSELIAVENNGKQAFSFDGIQFSDFEFEAVGIVSPMLEPFIWVLKDDGVIAINADLGVKGNRYFQNLNLKSINGIDANWEYEFDLLELKKANSKTFSLAKFNHETNMFKVIGDFDLEDVAYDEYLTDAYNLLKIKKGGKWGLIDYTTLETIVPFKYDEIKDELLDYEGDMIPVVNNKKRGVLAIEKGVSYEIVPAIYDEIENYEELLILKKKGLYGIYDIYKKELVLPTILKDKPDEGFLYASDFYDEFYSGKRAVVDGKEVYCYHTGKFGYVFGEQITQPKWGDDTFYYIHQNGKLGLIYNGLDTILKPEYTSVQIDENFDLLIIEKEEKFGVMNTRAKTILEIKYDEIIQNLDFDFFLLKKDNLYGIYQLDKEKLAIEFEEIIVTDEGIYASKNGEWYLYNLDFKIEEVHKAKSLKDFKKVLSRL